MICVIPARKGSKRVKNKNLLKIKNKTLIEHTIKIIQKSKLFKKIVVSTDCKKISKIAIKCGADVPFMRKKNLSGDRVGTQEVIKDAANNLKVRNSKYIFCVYPTSVLLNFEDLKKGLNKIERTNSDYLITMKKYVHPPQRSLKIKNATRYANVYKFSQKKRTQDFEQMYHDAGAFYIYKTSSLIKNKIKKKTYLLLGEYSFFDIDSYNDLYFVKFLKSYKFFNFLSFGSNSK